MRSQLNGSKDSRRSIGTTDNTQCACFFRSKAHQHCTKQYGKDTQLGSRTEYGETQVTEHRTEVCQRTHTHKDNRRQKAGLNQHIINEVHQSEVVRNLVQRHLPNILHHPAYHDHSVFICLNHTHITTGKVGNEHTESDGYQQQWFIVFLDT